MVSMIFSVRNSVTCPILRRMLGYNTDQQLPSLVSSHDNWRLSVPSWHEYVQCVMRCMPM